MIGIIMISSIFDGHKLICVNIFCAVDAVHIFFWALTGI